jgi:predicted nucleotidyltransferase
MFYEDVFKKLDERNIRYLVVGGFAVVFHGLVRLTVDLDLMVYLERENLLAFISAMKEIGFKPKIPINGAEFADPVKRNEWIKEKNMKVFTFCNELDDSQMVDIFIYEPIDFQEASSRGITIIRNGVKIPVVSLNDLIKLKELAGREQDIADVKALKQMYSEG